MRLNPLYKEHIQMFVQVRTFRSELVAIPSRFFEYLFAVKTSIKGLFTYVCNILATLYLGEGIFATYLNVRVRKKYIVSTVVLSIL